jgi:hypothetical protein
MTVPVTTTRVEYSNESAGPHEWSFPVASLSELVVTHIDDELVETVLTYTTEYSVAFNADGKTGSVTLVTPLLVDETVRIECQPDFSQIGDFEDGPYDPASVENALDHLARQTKRLKVLYDQVIDDPSASAAAAAASALAAAASAASAGGIVATSTTNITIGTGSKVFTVAAGLQFVANMPLRIASDAAPTADWMEGTVTTYSGTTLTMNVVSFQGSGAHTDWTIYPSALILNATLSAPTLVLADGAAITQAGQLGYDTANFLLMLGNGSGAPKIGTMRGLHAIPLPAVSWNTAGGGLDPAQEDADTGSRGWGVWTFDYTADGELEFALPMPDSWDGGDVYVQLMWGHKSGATTFGVSFDVAVASIGNAESMEKALSTADTIVDTGGAANTQYISALSGALTPAGGAGGETLKLYLLFDASASSIDADVYFIGARLYFTTNKELDE